MTRCTLDERRRVWDKLFSCYEKNGELDVESFLEDLEGFVNSKGLDIFAVLFGKQGDKLVLKTTGANYTTRDVRIELMLVGVLEWYKTRIMWGDR